METLGSSNKPLIPVDPTLPNSKGDLILGNPDPAIAGQIQNSAPDIKAVREFLQEQAPADLILDNFKLAWIKTNQEKGLRLLYKAESKGKFNLQHFFFAHPAPLQTGETLAGKLNRKFAAISATGIYQGFTRAALYSPQLQLLFQVFPADRRLPFLVKATDPKVMSPVLQQTIGENEGNGQLSNVTAAVIQYKPERKCLIRYDLDWQDLPSETAPKILYGKVFRKAERVYYDLENIYRFWRGTVFQIPKPMGFVPELCLELLGHVPGLHLSRVCENRKFPEFCQEIAKGLIEFQDTPVILGAKKDLVEELSELKKWGEQFILALPTEAQRIRNLILTLSKNLVSQERIPRKLVHGDFHVANILVDGERLGLLDFENCFMGNSAIDVGSFYAQLKLLSLKVYKEHTALDAGVNAFLQEYRKNSPNDLLPIIPTYCALSCLWCAYFQCILRPVKRGWLERAYEMMQLCEQILDSGALMDY